MEDTGNGKDKNPEQSNGRSHFEESGYGKIHHDSSDGNFDGTDPDHQQADENVVSRPNQSGVEVFEDDIKKKRAIKRYVWVFWGIIVLGFLCIVMMFTGISLGWFGFMPTFEELENPQSYLASEIISEDGTLLGTYYIENRSKVKFADISPSLIAALIATEDVRFNDHSGIDVKALGRVVYGAFTGQIRAVAAPSHSSLQKASSPESITSRHWNLVFVNLKNG